MIGEIISGLHKERSYSQCSEIKGRRILVSTRKIIKERSINYDGIGKPVFF
jgi:hypothetical protein